MAHRLVATLVMALAAVSAADAQDRMPPIPAQAMTDAQKKAAEEFRQARGTTLSGPFMALMRSPEVLSRARAMGDYLRFKSVLPPRLSEFVILMTAREWTQHYEWNAHRALALKGGLDEKIVQAVAEGRRPVGMADDEAILYDFFHELQRNQSVTDATYVRAVAKFGEQGIIDTIGIVGYYTLLAMVLNTARTPVPSSAVPPLPLFPR